MHYILILIVLVSCFTGCSNNNNQNETIVITVGICYADQDNDEHGDSMTPFSAEICDGLKLKQHSGIVFNHDDCDDLHSDIHPNAPDWCNDGIDNNCDGKTDNNCIIYNK